MSYKKILPNKKKLQSFSPLCFLSNVFIFGLASFSVLRFLSPVFCFIVLLLLCVCSYVCSFPFVWPGQDTELYPPCRKTVRLVGLQGAEPQMPASVEIYSWVLEGKLNFSTLFSPGGYAA